MTLHSCVCLCDVCLLSRGAYSHVIISPASHVESHLPHNECSKHATFVIRSSKEFPLDNDPHLPRNITVSRRLAMSDADDASVMKKACLQPCPRRRYFIGGRLFSGGCLLREETTGTTQQFTVEVLIDYVIYLDLTVTGPVGHRAAPGESPITGD